MNFDRLLKKGICQADPACGRSICFISLKKGEKQILPAMKKAEPPSPPSHKSPEQARGEKLDASTDIFSFGAVLYEMASGRQPFAGASGAETLTAILRDTPVPPSQLNPQLPSKLEKIINKALDKTVTNAIKPLQKCAPS